MCLGSELALRTREWTKCSHKYLFPLAVCIEKKNLICVDVEKEDPAALQGDQQQVLTNRGGRETIRCPGRAGCQWWLDRMVEPAVDSLKEVQRDWWTQVEQAFLSWRMAWLYCYYRRDTGNTSNRTNHRNRSQELTNRKWRRWYPTKSSNKKSRGRVTMNGIQNGWHYWRTTSVCNWSRASQTSRRTHSCRSARPYFLLF